MHRQPGISLNDRYLLTALAGAVLLLWPAVYNRFPLIFPDTDAYLTVALGHSWTVDRSAFYGLALKPFVLADPVIGLWTVVFVQGLISATLVVAVVRAAAPDAPPRFHVMLLALIAGLSTLPWHAAQLMPDAFTAPLILLLWLVLQRDPADPGAPLLWLCVIACTLMHYTHLVILVAVSVAIVSAQAGTGKAVRSILRNTLAIVACCCVVVTTQVVSNGVLVNRWTVSPMGSYFLFARLQEDGLIGDWMGRHCGRDASAELCAIYPGLPKDSQVLLWQTQSSPLQQHINERPGSAESWTWIDRVQQAVAGSLREEPLRFAANSVEAGAQQFMHFAALDDECPVRCQSFPEAETKSRLAAAIHNSRQVKGTIARPVIRAITTVFSIAGLILLLPAAWLAWRRRSPRALSLVAAVAAGLCSNALVTGALSDVHDRYQSRLIWLALLVAVVSLRRLWHGEVAALGARSPAVDRS